MSKRKMMKFTEAEEKNWNLHCMCENANAKGLTEEELPYSKQKDLYTKIHGDNSAIAKSAKRTLVEATLYLAVGFMRNDFDRYATAEMFQEYLQECFCYIAELVDRWDIGVITSFHQYVISSKAFMKVYRYHYKDISMRPQTGIQEDAKIRKFAETYEDMFGEKPDALAIKELLGIKESTVDRALNTSFYKKDIFVPLSEIIKYDSSLENVIDVETSAMVSISEDDFFQTIKEHVRDDSDAFLVLNAIIDGATNPKEAQTSILEKTGNDIGYQHVYRAMEKLGAIIVFYNLAGNATQLESNMTKGQQLCLQSMRRSAAIKESRRSRVFA